MTAGFKNVPVLLANLIFCSALALNAGCASDSYAAKGAAEGATTGAVAGAVGGMMTALIFGGNVAEAGARGAVYGGSTGAVVGGMSGSKVDKAVAEQERAERDAAVAEFRKEIGDDAFNGVVALAECKHEIAIANGREAAKSKNRDFALAGIWVEVLAEADRNRDAEAHALFPELVSRDKKISSEAEAETNMRNALQRLIAIREEYELPANCPA